MLSPSTKPILKMLALLGVAGTICATTPSCRENDETLFIRQIQLPAAPDCVAKPDPTAEYIPRGTLDIALSVRYVANVLIGNQLVARGDYKQTRAEPNRILITGADVHLIDLGVAGEPEISFYSVNATGEVDPQTNGDATYGLAGLELIPPSIGQKVIYNDLLASVQKGQGSVHSYETRFKIYGTTLGGTNVESGEYDFDIDVCFGCTVIFPSDAYDPTIDPKDVNCKKAGEVTLVTENGEIPACIAGQDGVTDCRECQGNPICTPCLSDADCVTAETGNKCVASHCIAT